eukprot:TRINITY_DN14764_c0_g1_i1.p1 TRINITY_DN14764_c0_g1~~TRINITY_DN14764_c0_g1_i1.p1  ORF type:complete len:419 (-),score=90.72 TRINITY_DN14764_c0_g1_i1:922-2178(-)
MFDADTAIHLVSGGVAGTTGAICTCPLEVVKTRLQSSNSGFDTTVAAAKPVADTSTTAANGGASRKKAKQIWKRPAERVTYRPVFGSHYTSSVNLLLRGGNGCNFGSATPILYSTQSQPCRPIKTKLSSFPDRARSGGGKQLIHSVTQARVVHTVSMPEPTPRKSMGVWTCLRHIWVHEGPKGLFRGLGPNLVGVAPTRAIYFWAYSTCKQKLNVRLPRRNRDTPFVHLVSAFSAGFVSSCVTNPIWLIKTRLQLDRSEGGLISVIRNIHSEKGIAGFWKGVTASWWGISETMIHFVIYESLKKTLNAHHQNVNKSQERDFSYFVGLMACGATSKSCATCIAYPHEVARTRMRESGSKYRSFWQTLFLVYREGGWRELYRGLATQLVRQIPNTAITMATYELTLYVLTNYLREQRNQR